VPHPFTVFVQGAGFDFSLHDASCMISIFRQLLVALLIAALLFPAASESKAISASRATVNGTIKRLRGRRASSGTTIPVVPIEKFGVPQLFYAKENPDLGIEVLEKGLRAAKEKKYIAYDLGVLLRNEKRYEGAIEAFSVVLGEDPTSEICRSVYQERSQLYKAIGQFEKAEEDKRRWATAFERKFGHPPSAQESF